jgi:hypothetical protein
MDLAGADLQAGVADGANAANGHYDLRFILFNVNQSGSPVGPILTNPNVIVASLTNGPSNLDPRLGTDDTSQKLHTLNDVFEEGGEPVAPLFPPPLLTPATV